MSGQTCLVAMYHYVRDSAATGFPNIRALPPDVFEQQLDWLQRNHEVVTLADLEATLDGAGPLPPNAALLTFDDGVVDHYTTVLPILKARGLTGVFFLAQDACGPSPRMLAVHKTHFLLATRGAAAFADDVLRLCQAPQAPVSGGTVVYGADDWDERGERFLKHLLNYELPFDEVERVLDTLFLRHIGNPNAFARGLYLNGDMVAEMAGAGMVFGYHTRTHRMLSRLDRQEQDAELRDGVAWIRELTGQAQVSFCYPWGGANTYTADTLDLLRARGYSVAFNTVRRHVTVGVDGRFELPRIDTRDLPPYTQSEQDAAAAAAIEEA